jgi:hypothetical protein
VSAHSDIGECFADCCAEAWTYVDLEASLIEHFAAELGSHTEADPGAVAYLAAMLARRAVAVVRGYVG